MKHWKQHDGYQFQNSPGCHGYEFTVDGAPLNIAVITVSSRYPEVGYAYNEEAYEMAYVARGRGTIEVKGSRPIELSTGDVVYFEPEERIAWDGEMVLVVPCSPAFNPDKHKEEL